MLEQTYNHYLDITAETCPMTYVRTRLALDRIATGETLAVRLSGAEPELNVPRNALQQGHQVLATDRGADGTLTILIRKG
jgi:TusA-related sulfurtransferase